MRPLVQKVSEIPPNEQTHKDFVQLKSALAEETLRSRNTGSSAVLLICSQLIWLRFVAIRISRRRFAAEWRH